MCIRDRRDQERVGGRGDAMRTLRGQRGVAATGGADLQRADGAEAAGAAGRTDRRATEAFAVSDLLHPGQVGPSCAANPAAAGAELAALFQLAPCPALAALAGVRLTQAKSSQAKQTQQPGARAGSSLPKNTLPRTGASLGVGLEMH